MSAPDSGASEAHNGYLTCGFTAHPMVGDQTLVPRRLTMVTLHVALRLTPRWATDSKLMHSRVEHL